MSPRSFSNTFKQAAFSSETSEAVLLLVEIDHADLASPIRVTSDGVNLEGTDNLFSNPDSLTTSAGWVFDDATYTGGKLIENTTGGTHNIRGGSISFTSGETYTFSGKAKAAERHLLQIDVSDTYFGTNSYANFDLTNGVAYVGAVGSASIADIGSGEYLCSYTVDAIDNAVSHGLFQLMETLTVIPSYTGTSGYGLYLREPQCENKDHVTPYTSDSRSTYAAFPFSLVLPDDAEDQLTCAKITIDNVDRQIVEAVRSINSPPTVTLSIILASDPNTIEAGPFEFKLLNCTWNALTVEGELGYSVEVLGKRYPAHSITPQYFPGLFTG